jgi:hypothetical protein
MASWDTPAVAAPPTSAYGAPAVNFAPIANLLNDFVKGRQEAREEDKANAFRNGIPRDSNGDPDFNKITDTAARTGGIDYALPLLKLQTDRQAAQMGASAIANPSGVPQPAAASQAAPVGQTTASPSVRSASAGPVQSPAAPASSGGSQQPTVMTIAAAQGFPNDQIQAVSDSLARQLGVGPNDPIDTKDPRVANVLGPAIAFLKKNNVGQVVGQNGQPALQPAQPQAIQSAPNDRVAQGFNAAQPGSDQGTPGMDQATADRLSNEASMLRARAAGLSAINPKVSEVLTKEADARDARSKQIRDYISGEDASTPDQKNYQSDKLPGESMADYQARVAGAKELASQDSQAYSKKYEGIQKAAQEASIEQPKIQLMKTFANDPNFYSGPLEPTNRGFKQFAATVGLDPNKALPQEGFNKVASDMLTSQIRALGASGAGPVRIAEVKNMQKSIANLGITPVTNRLLVEITDRAYNDVKNIANLTRQYANDKNNRPGQMNVGLDQKIQDYYDSHPLFTKDEIADPRLIAPPEFKDARSAFNAKLPKGQPVKIDGKLKWVQ